MRHSDRRISYMLQWNAKYSAVLVVSLLVAIAALVLFGWAPATFIYVTAPTIVALVWRTRPAIRAIFNAGVFGFVGALAGWILTYLNGNDAEMILAKIAVTSATLYVVNIVLVT